jgi:hypothetical protein
MFMAYLIAYLVNTKGLQEPEVLLILEKWIKECDKRMRIDFDYKCY